MGQTNTSILSRFPEYGFKSTSVYNNRATGRKWLLALFIFLGVIGGLYFAVFITLGFGWQLLDVNVQIFSMALIVDVILIISLIIWYKKCPLPDSFSDYIQAKGRNRIFVKGGKFGLVKSLNYKILIPAMYDKLMWVQDNEVLKAYLNGEEFLIDIHNNKLS